MDTSLQFWNWFKDNHQAYLLLDSAEEDVQEKLLNEFEEELHKYCDKLFFEIGGDPDADQEIIITSEGDENYFEEAEQLVSRATTIDGWTFIALKPSIPGHFKSKWDDIELNTEDMWFVPIINGKESEFGIKVLLKNYYLINENEVLIPLLYKMLETILGEKRFALDIASVDVGQLLDTIENQRTYSIIELPKNLEEYKILLNQRSS